VGFCIICRYLGLLILLGVSFVKIVQIVSILGVIEIHNVLAMHPDDNAGITMPHDPCNQKEIFSIASAIMFTRWH
jgi:hypothetical protein